MRIVEITRRGYNAAENKWELCALVRNPLAFGGFEYKMFLFVTAEEMYAVKVGDILN